MGTTNWYASEEENLFSNQTLCEFYLCFTPCCQRNSFIVFEYTVTTAIQAGDFPFVFPQRLAVFVLKVAGKMKQNQYCTEGEQNMKLEQLQVVQIKPS